MKRTLREQGQASIEYVLVVGFCLAVLLLAVPDESPVTRLIAAIRNFFAAYSYAISITS